MNKMIEQAFQLFDAYNRNDPSVIEYQGTTYPETYFYSLKLHEWVLKLDPDPGEALLLASRCQHIGRWEKPRESYPAGKAGYLNWRSDLAIYHAEKAALLLKEIGYSEEMIANVQRIILKKKIKLDPEVQLMENALCLVFLQYQFDVFLLEHEDDKIVHILRKSWSKMNEQGRNAASALSFSQKGSALIARALG